MTTEEKKAVPDNPCADCDHEDCFLNPNWDGSEGVAKRVIEESVEDRVLKFFSKGGFMPGDV